MKKSEFTMRECQVRLAFIKYIKEIQKISTNTEILQYLENIKVAKDTLEVFNHLFKLQEATKEDLEVLNDIIAEYRKYYKDLVSFRKLISLNGNL